MYTLPAVLRSYVVIVIIPNRRHPGWLSKELLMEEFVRDGSMACFCARIRQQHAAGMDFSPLQGRVQNPSLTMGMAVGGGGGGGGGSDVGWGISAVCWLQCWRALCRTRAKTGRYVSVHARYVSDAGILVQHHSFGPTKRVNGSMIAGFVIHNTLIFTICHPIEHPTAPTMNSEMAVKI